jgi:hypothetical protein
MAKARDHGDCRTRRSQCRRKVRYPTRQAAWQAVAALYRLRSACLFAYRCGDHWHLGHNRRPR